MKKHFILIGLLSLFLFIPQFCLGQSLPPETNLGYYKVVRVIDGDTIDVVPADIKDASGQTSPPEAQGPFRLRLLCVDTEEVSHSESEIKQMEEMGFEKWKEKMKTEKGPLPKYPTPLGLEASNFGKKFFEDHPIIRIFRDYPNRLVGYYGRSLAYVVAKEGEKEINYNLELVKLGLSPYSTKYSQSRFLHEDFQKAQAEAKEKQIGIWAPDGEHYDDYDERLVWWERRGKAIANFDEKYAGKEGVFHLSTDFDFEDFKPFEGKEITVFGAVSEIKNSKMPHLIFLSHKNRQDFVLVTHDENLLKEMEFEKYMGEWIFAKGILIYYKGKPEIELKDPNQVWVE